MRRTVLSLLCLLSLAAAAEARADEDVREKVRERIRTFRAAKLIELLDLDEKTAAKLFPILNRYDDQMGPIIKDSGEARREIRQQIKSGKADDAKLNKLIDRVLANREKIQKLDVDRFKEVRKVLTPVQAAKASVALPEIDRMIQREIRKAVRGRGKGGRGGPGGGPGDDDDFKKGGSEPSPPAVGRPRRRAALEYRLPPLPVISSNTK